MTESSLKDLLRECLSEFESAANIWRGWSFPVGGSTPDRHKDGTIHPRQVSVCDSEFVNSSPPQLLPFPSSLQCSCVDGSFRSGVQPPTGTKSPERMPI